MTGKFQVLLSCQVQGCAEEVSYHMDMLKLFRGKPICQSCYEYDYVGDESADWHDLPDISMEDLCP